MIGIAVGDPEATRTVYGVVIGLAVIGVVLVIVAIWLIRQTRVDPELLAPLERMDTRLWSRRDPATQRRMLDEVRPEGAEPLHRERAVPALDAEFEAELPTAAGFDDLKGGVDLSLDESPKSASTADDDAAAEADSAADAAEDADAPDDAGEPVAPDTDDESDRADEAVASADADASADPEDAAGPDEAESVLDATDGERFEAEGDAEPDEGDSAEVEDGAADADDAAAEEPDADDSDGDRRSATVSAQD